MLTHQWAVGDSDVGPHVGTNNGKFLVYVTKGNMYLGKIENREDQNKLKAKESFLISENGYTLGRLLDSTKCQLLLDTGVSKSFMSKL